MEQGMEDYGQLTHAELISLIREPKAGQGSADCPAGEKRAEFPVFSEWQQREFDRSPWPMRIFEHGSFRFLAVNDAAVKLYGYSREEFLKLTARDTRHLDEHAEFLTTLNEPTEYLRHRGARRHIRKNGEIIVVEAVTQDILFNGRKARLSMNIDVTERRQAERALHESESKYRNLVESSSDLIWSADAAGRITFINQAVRQIYGYEPAEMLGRPVGEFFGSGHRKKAFSFFRQMLAEGRSRADYECEVRHKNGQPVVLSSNAIVVRDDEGNRIGVTGISKDITDRKRGEQERLTHAIQQRDALVREVHHRIKNSLQGVVGLLRQKIGRSPGVAHEIEEAIAQLQSVALVYGLQETRTDGLLSLAEITNAICSSAESLIGGCVERSFERKSQRPACLAGAEAVSVAVALNELVFNALKHQPAAAGEKRACIVLRESADEAEIRITNPGQLPAGFDFATGGALGSGLGLVRTLLASPGGTVTFNGKPGEVEVVLELCTPLLAGRQQPVAK